MNKYSSNNPYKLAQKLENAADELKKIVKKDAGAVIARSMNNLWSSVLYAVSAPVLLASSALRISLGAAGMLVGFLARDKQFYGQSEQLCIFGMNNIGHALSSVVKSAQCLLKAIFSPVVEMSYQLC